MTLRGFYNPQGGGGGGTVDPVAQAAANTANTKVDAISKPDGQVVADTEMTFHSGKLWENTSGGDLTVSTPLPAGFTEVSSDTQIDDLIIGTTPFIGAAPAGAEFAVDTTTGMTYYVDAGNWVASLVPEEDLNGSHIEPGKSYKAGNILHRITGGDTLTTISVDSDFTFTNEASLLANATILTTEGTNILNSNITQTANRSHDMMGFTLQFKQAGTRQWTVNGDGSMDVDTSTSRYWDITTASRGNRDRLTSIHASAAGSIEVGPWNRVWGLGYNAATDGTGTWEQKFNVDMRFGTVTVTGQIKGLLPGTLGTDAVNLDQLNKFDPFKAARERMESAAFGADTGYQIGMLGDSTADNATNDMIANQTAFYAKINMALVDASRSGMDFKEWYENTSSPNLTEFTAAITGTGDKAIVIVRPGLNGWTRLAGDMVALKAEFNTGLDAIVAALPDIEIVLSVPIYTGNTQRNADLQKMFIELSQERSLPLLNTFDAMEMVHDGPASTNALRFYYDNTHQTPVGGLRTIIAEGDQLAPASLYDKLLIDENYRAGSTDGTTNLATTESGFYSTSAGFEGSEQANAAWLRISPIAVVAGEDYTVTHTGNRTHVFWMSDTGGTFLSEEQPVKDGNNSYTVTAPVGAVEVRINLTSEIGGAYDPLVEPAPTVFGPGNYIETIEEMLVGLNIRLAKVPGATEPDSDATAVETVAEMTKNLSFYELTVADGGATTGLYFVRNNGTPTQIQAF